MDIETIQRNLKSTVHSREETTKWKTGSDLLTNVISNTLTKRFISFVRQN